jgi:hypothetical protein
MLFRIQVSREQAQLLLRHRDVPSWTSHLVTAEISVLQTDIGLPIVRNHRRCTRGCRARQWSCERASAAGTRSW